MKPKVIHVKPLTPDTLQKMGAYWRAANDLAVGQIHLQDNPLQECRSRWQTSSRACWAIGARHRA